MRTYEVHAQLVMCVRLCFSCLERCSKAHTGLPLLCHRRWMGLITKNWERKRFYGDVTVYKQPPEEGTQFGIQLDHRKLRTPQRNLFLVPSESLAVAVCQEWSAQQHLVQASLMHITALCNTVIDNPLNQSRDTQVEALFSYLDSDTICFRATEPDDLVAMQQKEWDPIIKWFNERYEASVDVSTSLFYPTPPTFPKRLLSDLCQMDSWTFTGFEQAVDSCKSLILSCALFAGHISPVVAGDLARLETRHQISCWGSVEWQHGVEAADLTSRLAASLLLKQFTANITCI